MPITWPWKWRMSSCRRLRLRCCKQLEQMPPSCRCRAIRSTVQDLQGGLPGSDHHQMMSKVMEMAKTLPSICNITDASSYCNIPTTGSCCY
ncbi:hordoindoline-A-like [Panicum miliaceum]|uniref:Hordoindoline-A-like n=1 Tax=Panicum miliaceum TaxID=4540 RepID=A0A3L6R8V5_PANMI|nr:hordoindoline-A-like [Panicum miliaceum]